MEKSLESLTKKPKESDDMNMKMRTSNTRGDKIQMKKGIGLLHATTIMTGIMIGSGIFVSPVSITHHCGSIGLSSIIWLLSGILVLLGALGYTDIGTMLPFAGGE